jgi:hypothetical protein
MEKYILAFCATLLAIDAASAAVKPEAGKYYLIEAARPNGEGRYLANTKVDSRSGLYRSDDITANNIWCVAEGSVAGTYTVQNYVTKGYLFEGEWGDTNVTKAETIDVYLPENTETTAENVYAVTPVNTGGYFLNCWIGNSGTTVYSNGYGSGWLFTPIDTEGQTIEEAIAGAFFRVNGITYHVTSQQNKTVEVFTGDYSGSVTIPETVSNAGSDYTVTALTDNAFRDCTGLTDIELPATLTSIGAAAFRSCLSLASVAALNPEPPTIGNNAFAGADIQLAFVPAEAVEAYQAANGWNDLYILDVAEKTNGVVARFTVDGINYHVTSFKDKTVEILRGDYYGDIVIPEIVTYNDTEYTVTEIESSAFEDCSLTSIKLPSSITTIRDHTFKNCSALTSIELPSSLRTIESWAIEACTSLKSIELPESLTTIEDGAFYNCTALTDINIPSQVTTISGRLFDSCTALSSLVIPTTITSIAGEAFANCTSLAVITSLNPTPPSLDGSAFDGCGILAVYVPSDAVEAYQAAENWNNFNIVDVATSGEDIVTSFTVDGINYRVTSIHGNNVSVVAGDYSGDIVIPETVTYADTEYIVTEIAERAFRERSSLTSIKLPSSITKIGNASFALCNSLKTFEVPSSVTTMGDEVFWGCGSLESVTIPSSVTSMGYSVFCFCESLTSVEIPSSVVTINSGSLFYGCSLLTSVKLPESLTTIGEYMFRDCSSLTSIELPAALTRVEHSAFEGCTSLTSIKLPSSIRIIGDHTFKNCSALTSIELPSSLRTIESWAFEACTSLTSIELPELLTTIEYGAFYNCTALSSLVIPTTITSIEGEAFANCTSLAVITSLNPTPPSLDGSAFDGCSILSVYVPSDAVEAYQAAENWNNFNIVDVATSGEGIVTNFTVDCINYRVTSLKDNRVSVVAGDYSGDIVIPATVTYDEKEFVVDKIGYEAFSGCSAVTGITIPSTVTQIDSYAFCGTAISSISIPNSVNRIGWYALNECPQLKAFTIEDGETALTIGDSLGNDLWTGETIETLYVGRNIEFDGQYGAFDSNGNLKSVTFGEQVTNIYDWFFYNDTSLTSVTIPGSVTSIGDYAFCGCRSLAVIELPSSISKIGGCAFFDCYSLSKVIILNPEPPTIDGGTFNECPIVAVYVPAEAVEAYQTAAGWKEFYIADVATKDEELVTNFTVDGINYHVISLQDNNVEVVSGDYSGDIVIPETVTYNDTEYTVTKIADSAFRGKGITSIEIPASVITIGRWAFEYCRTLASITSLNPEPPTPGENTFNECPILAVYVTAEAIEAYQTADGWKDFYIADVATKDEELVTNFTVDGINYRLISLQDNNVEVVSSDYEGDIVIPETVTYNDTEYTVTKIADSAFQWRGITSIEIPATVTSIGKCAFQGANITTVEIPETVTSIGSWAFEYCVSLISITSLNPVPPTADGSTFYGCPIVAVFVPAEAIEAYQTADGWKDFYFVDIANKDDVNFTVDGINYFLPSLQDSNVEIVHGNYSGDFVIPETVTYNNTEYTVTKIADSAFRWNGITSIEIPASVTTIGSWAFEGCGSLASITSLNPEPPTTGENTFNECSILAVYVPAEAIETYQTADVWKDFYIVDIANKVDFNFSEDGINYRITSLKDNTVMVVTGDYSGDIVIPETVTYNDVEYTVTKIAESAFEERDITSIEISASVTTIGSWAFEGCSLTSITVLNPEPPTVDESAFWWSDIEYVLVPADAVNAYKEADVWKDFFIKGLGLSSINEVSAADNEEVVCYTLHGLRVTKVRTMKDLKSLTTGVYIVNGKKVLVK